MSYAISPVVGTTAVTTNFSTTYTPVAPITGVVSLDFKGTPITPCTGPVNTPPCTLGSAIYTVNFNVQEIEGI